MNIHIIFIVFLLSCFCLSINAQPLPKRTLAQTGYLEYQTSYREKLIYLDTIIIDQIIYTLNKEGCSNLKYFLQPFHETKNYLYYPVGFNFAKFKVGFGNKLKKEICRALAENEICIDQVIENIFAPGICRESGHCLPLYDLVFIDKDFSLNTLIKKRISMNDYRFSYNSFYKTSSEAIASTNKKWITLFSPEELSLIDKEQFKYLQSLSKNQN